MSIAQRKEHEGARLRQRILDAALRVFVEEGYAQVSMRKIAARIDYSPTTIYRYFDNKEALLQTIAAGTYEALAARFARAKAGGGEPLDILKSVVKEYVVFCVEHPDMFRLFSDIASFDVEAGRMYERLGHARREVFQSWFECIRQARAEGRCADADEMRIFLYVWDAVDGYVGHRIRHLRLPRKSLSSDVDEFLDLLFRGIEMSPSKTARRNR